MGILSALWRLSRLSWVSHGARWWPGLFVTWWMPAEKAPFQAARGSCQHRSAEEICWHPPAAGTLPRSPLPAAAVASHASKCAAQRHGAGPHLIPPLHGRTHSDSALVFRLPKSARVPVGVLHPSLHPIRIPSSLLDLGSHAWDPHLLCSTGWGWTHPAPGAVVCPVCTISPLPYQWWGGGSTGGTQPQQPQ